MGFAEHLRILKRRTRVQASDDEELPVALDEPVIHLAHTS